MRVQIIHHLCVYDVRVLPGITGPDDFHQNVNNNAFTLCAVSLAIHWARYFSCICEKNERVEVPDEYIQKALYLNLPYDNIKRLHYAHEGFDPGLLLGRIACTRCLDMAYCYRRHHRHS